MLCILFAVPSFAQMVGASSISQKQKKTQEYSVEKHEFSIQAGGGDDFNETFVTSGIMKYKFKPSTKYDIRLLGEIGIIISDSEYPETGISTIPILFGLNYERKLSQNWSIFTDFGLGLSVPLGDPIKSEYSVNYYYYNTFDYYTSYTAEERLYQRYDNFSLGFALSPEIGFIYKKFMFSLKYAYSLNAYEYTSTTSWYYDYYGWSDDYYGNEASYHSDLLYSSHYLVLTLGYRF